MQLTHVKSDAVLLDHDSLLGTSRETKRFILHIFSALVKNLFRACE